MAFNVGDIVKKINGSQKYEVMIVLPEKKYNCKYSPRPPYSETAEFVFKEDNLKLA